MASSESVIEQLCDAVVAELNAQTGFSQQLAATKQMPPRLDRAKLSALQVVVAPRTRRNSILNRGALKQLDFKVGIGFYKGMASNDDREVLPLILLCEQVGEHFPFFQTTIDTGQNMTCVESRQGDDETPLFDVEQVDELFQFTAIVDLLFRGAR